MEGTISKKALILWEALAFAAAALIAGLVCFFFPPHTFFWYLLLWLDGLALVLCEFLYLPLRYENERYFTDDEYVEYQRGFLILVRSRILRRAVLYVTIIRTPFSLLFGTRTIQICSMGTRMIIPFLPKEEAYALLRELTPKAPAIRPRLFERKESRHE